MPIVGKDLKTDHRPPAELKLERVERMLTAVAAALEVLTGICAGLEDAEEGMDEDAEADGAGELLETTVSNSQTTTRKWKTRSPTRT